jgi:hypothetical protein
MVLLLLLSTLPWCASKAAECVVPLRNGFTLPSPEEGARLAATAPFEGLVGMNCCCCSKLDRLLLAVADRLKHVNSSSGIQTML